MALSFICRALGGNEFKTWMHPIDSDCLAVFFSHYCVGETSLNSIPRHVCERLHLQIPLFSCVFRQHSWKHGKTSMQREWRESCPERQSVFFHVVFLSGSTIWYSLVFATHPKQINIIYNESKLMVRLKRHSLRQSDAFFSRFAHDARIKKKNSALFPGSKRTKLSVLCSS